MRYAVYGMLHLMFVGNWRSNYLCFIIELEISLKCYGLEKRQRLSMLDIVVIFESWQHRSRSRHVISWCVQNSKRHSIFLRYINNFRADFKYLTCSVVEWWKMVIMEKGLCLDHWSTDNRTKKLWKSYGLTFLVDWYFNEKVSQNY